MTEAVDQPICWIPEYFSASHYYMHGVREILVHKRTAFQELFIVKSDSLGTSLVLDGKWQSSSADEFMFHEAIVHPGLLAHGRPRSVLILGGGEGATLREVLKWKSVERAVMVDIDEEVVRACMEWWPEANQGAYQDRRAELVFGDAGKLIAESPAGAWDVVIADLTDPIESGPAADLCSVDFFTRIQKVIAPGGYLVTQAGPVGPSYEDVKHHAKLVKTLQSVFRHVVSYSVPLPTNPAPWGFALCGEEPIAKRPVPEDVDAALSRNVSGALRMLDGEALLGLLQTPLHVRRMIEEEQEIYSNASVPRIFGKGVASAT